MNNFEKRKMLDYLIKLLPVTDTNDYSFDDVFDFLCLEFNINRKPYPIDKDNCLEVNTPKQKEHFAKLFRKDIIRLIEKIKPRNTFLENQFLTIKKIYQLSNDEYEMFLFLALKEVNNIFKKYSECLFDHSFDTFTRVYLNMRYSRKDRVMDTLYMKNIIENRRSESLNPNILKILDNPNCRTSEKMMNILIGKPEKSQLTLCDYKHIEKEINRVTKILSCAVEQKRKGVNILLHGEVGQGKSELSRLLSTLTQIPMYSVITQKGSFEEASREDRLVDLYSKQHILANSEKACILFDEAEDVMNRGFSSFGSASKGYLNHLLESTAVPIIWTTNDIYGVDPAFLRRMTYCIEFKALSEDKRLNIWKRVLKKNNFKVSKEKIEELNRNYEVPASLIANAVQTAKMIGGDENDFEELIENVAKVVTKKEEVKKQEKTSNTNYSIDLVNADMDMANLSEKIKQSGKMNFSLCLYGFPGTGKSAFCKHLCEVLGIEVLLKRASDLISPYVGETEKNIANAFAEAKSKKAMLIFDEADTFLQDRTTAVRGWEISQVNEMLTQMESAEYPFACTTNLLDTLDEASLRRFTFKIKFDFMTNQQVSKAMEHFFGGLKGINKESINVKIKGLTVGDFATVKKKADFLNTSDVSEIIRMLNEEVKIKKIPELNKNTIGF